MWFQSYGWQRQAIVHADEEFQKLPAPTYTFFTGESLVTIPKNTPLFAKVMVEFFTFLFFDSWLPINLQTRIPLALGVLFSEAMLTADFERFCATRNICPLKIITFWRRKNSKTVSGTSQVVQSGVKVTTPPKTLRAGNASSRNSTSGTLFRFLKNRNFEKYSWFCEK